MMAFLLLLVAMLATYSSVFADKYLERIQCDGEVNLLNKEDKYCPLNYEMGPRDLRYYEVDLIEDHSTIGWRCQHTAYYVLEFHNNIPSIRVPYHCNGTFGLRARNAGYPYKGGCGQDNGPGVKIINGNFAKPCKFPWMAFVRKDWSVRKERGTCGGSIVSTRWILTAAHCIINQYRDGGVPPASAMKVYTGTLDKWDYYIEREIDMIVIHPEYTYRKLRNDIALLRLAKPIKYDGCHSPVCLNTNMTIATNKRCLISGWGQAGLNPNQWLPELLWAEEYMLSRKTCDRIYRSTSSDKTICGRASSGGHSGFCFGDSGGPLVCKDDDNGRYYQHGIVSRFRASSPCRMQSVYSRVAYFYDWIMSYIQ